MSGVASIEPLIERAAHGILPGWAQITDPRLEHSRRVAELLGRWAEQLGLDLDDQTRWRATGWLHDALRDADPASLREILRDDRRELPDPLLHGPSAARLLQGEGVDDPEILDAIRYHTTGHPSLGTLGRALYLADALEPGRTYDPVWTASIRAQLPERFDELFPIVLAQRISHLIERGQPLRPETVDLWNASRGE